MHDCRKTKEQITELVLDGADGRADEVLSAELRACGDCRAEFEALSATLRITTRLKETAVPAESYWPGYHARLRQKLTNANVSSAHTSRRDSWLVQFFKSSVPVPLPVVAALIIACAILVPIAIRTAGRPITQAPTIVQVPVEVPVIQEKVVTRVVYRERRSPRKKLATSDRRRCEHWWPIREISKTSDRRYAGESDRLQTNRRGQTHGHQGRIRE